MFLSPTDALHVLEYYKYLLIFPITIVEGPIITVIGGFLAYLGYLNIYIAYFMLALGDLIGDCLHYFIGRYYSKTKWFEKTAKYFGYDNSKEKLIEEHFRKHPGKTLVLSKVSHGVGGVVQIVAGMAKMDFWQFLKFCLYGTLPKSLVLFLVGYYLGSSYEKISLYFDRIAYVFFVLFVILLLYFYIKNRVKKEVLE